MTERSHMKQLRFTSMRWHEITNAPIANKLYTLHCQVIHALHTSTGKILQVCLFLIPQTNDTPRHPYLRGTARKRCVACSMQNLLGLGMGFTSLLKTFEIFVACTLLEQCSKACTPIITFALLGRSANGWTSMTEQEATPRFLVRFLVRNTELLFLSIPLHCEMGAEVECLSLHVTCSLGCQFSEMFL